MSDEKHEFAHSLMLILGPIFGMLNEKISSAAYVDIGELLLKYEIRKLAEGTTVFSPEKRLIYEREGSVIRFKNNLDNNEAREVMDGLFLGFSKEEQKDILHELTYYSAGEGKPGTVATAISRGLKGGNKLS